MGWSEEDLNNALESNPELSVRPQVGLSGTISMGPVLDSRPVTLMRSGGKKKRKPRKAEEESAQRQVVAWASKESGRWPELAYLHHSPNGGYRDEITGAKMKALGTKSGFPDLFLPVPNTQYHGLFIEMKSKTGKTSDSQREWANWLRSVGYMMVTCRNAEDAKQAIAFYLWGHGI